jgi:hypothetical protein
MKHIVGVCKTIFSIENHYLINKEWDRIADALTSKAITGTKLTWLTLAKSLHA